MEILPELEGNTISSFSYTFNAEERIDQIDQAEGLAAFPRPDFVDSSGAAPPV